MQKIKCANCAHTLIRSTNKIMIFLRYVESFLLGFLVACIALILQVFLSVFVEVSGHELTLSYAATYNFFGITIFFLIIALIEETLRFAVIYKKIYNYDHNTISSLPLHGLFIGSGFWSFEVILRFFKDPSISHFPFSVLSVLIIHVFASILILYCLKKDHILHNSILLLLVILLHTYGNVALFFFTQ